MQFICRRYLLELNANSKENADPETEAVIDQWLEWESTSLQVSYHFITGQSQELVSLLFITGQRWKSTPVEVIYLAVVGYGYSQLLIIGEGWEGSLLYVSYLSVGRVGGYSFYQ